MLLHLLLLLSLVGVASSTVFLALAVIAACTRPAPPGNDAPLPPASLLKPVHGMEPQLERNFESFFDQRYPAPLELLFCARTATDPAITLAREVSQRFPHVAADFLAAGANPYTNAKVWSLEQLLARASHDVLVVSDSDVEVTPDYAAEVVAPFADPQVGGVTCLYRGKPTGGLWSRLEGLGMSVEMTSGVLIANMLEGMRFALGPTMAFRREALAQIGGFGVFAEYCSDDFLLGDAVARRGWKVVLSHYVVDHVIQNRSFTESMRHQTRWMRSTRFSRPKGHAGTGLTFAMPYGILAALWGMLSHHAPLGMWLLAWCYVSRVLQSALVGGLVVRDRRSVNWSWLYPLRDLMGFGFWVASYVSSNIVWRGEVYQLQAEGKMVKRAGQPEAVSRVRSGC